jgi:ubiquinone/menaquinone biosynthesis C-methylase UbiE
VRLHAGTHEHGKEPRRDEEEGRRIDLNERAVRIVQRIGIRRWQTVLDFGCGFGTYTIPVARIIGRKGKVYALDKDKDALDHLMQKADSAHLKNMEIITSSGGPKIELPEESVDVALLFDVLHHYYFPQMDERRRLMDEIHRITKANGFISVWPKHLESEARDEIERANFYLEKEYSGTLIHNNKDIETGRVMNFRKKLGFC